MPVKLYLHGTRPRLSASFSAAASVTPMDWPRELWILATVQLASIGKRVPPPAFATAPRQSLLMPLDWFQAQSQFAHVRLCSRGTRLQTIA